MSIFGLLFLFIILWFLIIPLVKLLWRANKQARAWRDFYRQATGTGSGASSRSRSPFGSARKQQQHRQQRAKVFTKDVGEYVDFEEITDTETTTTTGRGSTTERTRTHTRYQGPAEPQVTDAEWEDIP